MRITWRRPLGGQSASTLKEAATLGASEFIGMVRPGLIHEGIMGRLFTHGSTLVPMGLTLEIKTLLLYVMRNLLKIPSC